MSNYPNYDLSDLCHIVSPIAKKKKEKEKKIITKDNDIVTEWKLVGNLQ